MSARQDSPATTTESTALTLREAADTFLENAEADETVDSLSKTEDKLPKTTAETEQAPAITDDATVTLKDGTELSIRDLKRGFLSQQAFTRNSQALSDERRSFETLQSHVKHYAALLDEQRGALDRAASALLPRQPDPGLIDSDPQAYKAALADYQMTMGLLAQAQRNAQTEREMAEKLAELQARDLRQRQQAALHVAMPELSKPEVARQFWNDAATTMALYGYSPEELVENLVDSRLYGAVRDLIRFQKALKTKVKDKIASRPVMTGGKRMDVNAKVARETKSNVERLKQTGRLEDGAVVLLNRMKAK